MTRIFQEYEIASGQKINYEKSSITFGLQVFQHTRDALQTLTSITNIGGGGKYLGLPEQFGRNKELFNFVKNNVLRKTQGWQTRFLTMAGKEVLIKSIAYVVPVFSMNCFQLPVELCNEIDSIISSFWWGSTGEKRKMSYVAWKKMTVSKQAGGMGFRELQKFNQAPLANQL